LKDVKEKRTTENKGEEIEKLEIFVLSVYSVV
jgi:hypothetical protein